MLASLGERVLGKESDRFCQDIGQNLKTLQHLGLQFWCPELPNTSRLFPFLSKESKSQGGLANEVMLNKNINKN